METKDKEDKREVVICGQDEARFGLITEIRKCWAPHPIRPTVIKHIKREALYCFACVCPQLGKISSLILPVADTEMMQLFLDEVSKEFSDYFLIIQLDRAGWHTSANLKIPDNIRLLFQPPASPQLQPVEHLWDHIRENFFAIFLLFLLMIFLTFWLMLFLL